MKLVVFGGGCWGHHHASGLLKAKDAGRTRFEGLVVVDRLRDHRVREAFGSRADVAFETSEWAAFLDNFVGSPAMGPEDMLVPAPVAPHLFMDWLLGALEISRPDYTWQRTALDDAVGTPFEATGPQGERFVSFAEWMCPPNCLEPSRCPAIRAPRTWEMPETVRELGARTGASGVEVFVSRHYAWGIAALPANDLVSARDRILASMDGQPRTFLVATTSACHGVIGRIAARPAEMTGTPSFVDPEGRSR